MGRNKQGDRASERTTEQDERTSQERQDPSRHGQATREAKPGTTETGRTGTGRTETSRTEQDRSEGTTGRTSGREKGRGNN